MGLRLTPPAITPPTVLSLTLRLDLVTGMTYAAMVLVGVRRASQPQDSYGDYVVVFGGYAGATGVAEIADRPFVQYAATLYALA